MAQIFQSAIGPTLFVVCIQLSVSEIIGILSVPKLWDVHENQVIQSLPGANPAKNVPNVCEMDCMFTCATDQNCMAYSFDGSDGSCKNWDHLLIEFADKAKAKSFTRSMIFIVSSFPFCLNAFTCPNILIISVMKISHLKQG